VEGMISLPSMCPDLLGISGCAGGLRGLRWGLAPNLSADARGWSSGRRFAWDMRGHARITGRVLRRDMVGGCLDASVCSGGGGEGQMHGEVRSGRLH
jgi:hypothetical protein